MGYDLLRFVGEIDEEFQCSICSMVFENPVETPCDHAFCKECITSWFSKEAVCPIDRTPLSLSELQHPCRLFRNLLAKLIIKCDYVLNGCKVTVQLEHLEKHVINCIYSPDSEIVCDNGCNGTIYRRELSTHNCLEYLSNLVSLKDVEISFLTSALNDQKEKCRKLTCELNDQDEDLVRLGLTVVSQDRQITQLEKTEQEQRDEIQSLKSPNEIMQKWKLFQNLRFCEHSNILEHIGPVDHILEKGHAQSVYHLRAKITSFKVEVLDRFGCFSFGLASADDRGLSDGSTLKYFISYGNINRYDKGQWNIGDIVECRIENFHLKGKGMFAYFSKNGKLIKKLSLHNWTSPVFPTISLSGVGSRVRVITE